MLKEKNIIVQIWLGDSLNNYNFNQTAIAVAKNGRLKVLNAKQCCF